MRSLNIKNIIAVLVLGFVVVLGSGQLANAQNSDWRQQRAIEEQQRQQAAEQERQRIEQERINNNTDPAWYNGNNGNRGYNNGSYNSNGRYRVMRNGRNYNTDGRGAELLRQAVNQGYQQGYAAGRSDRNSRRRSSYSNQNMYRSGNYGYQSYVDRRQYQYYFQQGFQRGYQDGYNSRNQYGTYNGGNATILSSILGTILNIQSY
jgi:hypothetical protein